jgi:hypothetical protein
MGTLLAFCLSYGKAGCAKQVTCDGDGVAEINGINFLSGAV